MIADRFIDRADRKIQEAKELARKQTQTLIDAETSQHEEAGRSAPRPS